MKLYIAGSSKELYRAERWLKACRDAGITITEDWAAQMRQAGPDHLLDEDRLIKAAQADLDGVATADVVWLLHPPTTAPSTGCWGELTYALAKGVTIITSQPTDAYGEASAAQFNIFALLVPKECRFASDAQACDAIVALSRSA